MKFGDLSIKMDITFSLRGILEVLSEIYNPKKHGSLDNYMRIVVKPVLKDFFKNINRNLII